MSSWFDSGFQYDESVCVFVFVPMQWMETARNTRKTRSDCVEFHLFNFRGCQRMDHIVGSEQAKWSFLLKMRTVCFLFFVFFGWCLIGVFWFDRFIFFSFLCLILVYKIGNIYHRNKVYRAVRIVFLCSN